MTPAGPPRGARRRAGAGTVLAWSLYELGATSVAMNMLSLHLPLDIATRVPRGNEKFSVAFALSMAVVALSAPFLGRLADERGKRPFLMACVLLGAGGAALVAAPGPVAQVLVIFAVTNVLYQCGYVFYNALLPDVTDETTQGRVSGYGVAAGYLGALLGMFLALPFVSGSMRAKLPGFLQSICSLLSVAPVSAEPDAGFVRVNAYVPTALFWLTAALPLLFLARLPRVARAASNGPKRSPLQEVLGTLRSLPKTPAILWFLVSTFLYMDVIHTIQIQMSTYSRFAVGFSDLEVQKFLLICTAVAVLGGLLYGFLCQLVTIRTATLVALGNWVVVFLLALVITNHTLFYAVGFLAGIGLGGLKVTARLGLVALVPEERMTEFFGFFTLAGEAASILGPVVWAGTLALFPDKSPTGYRAGLVALFLVLIGAVWTFTRVKFERPPHQESTAA